MGRKIVTHQRVLAEYTRGGFAWTRLISQRLGALAAVPAIRRGVHPSWVTLASLIVGVGTAISVVAVWPVTSFGGGVLAFVGWQIAYGLDCADGQVARATGEASQAGARLDITADFATRLALVSTLAWLAEGLAPEWTALASACYMFPLFDEATGRHGDATVPAVDRSSIAYRFAGLVRDSGAHKAAAGFAIGAGSLAATMCLVALGALGLTSLVVRVGLLLRRSQRTDCGSRARHP